MPGHIKKKKCLGNVAIGLDWTCSRRLRILSRKHKVRVSPWEYQGWPQGLSDIRHNADPVPTAKSGSDCFVLVLALRLSSQGKSGMQGWGHTANLQSLFSWSNFCSPCHPWAVGQKHFRDFFSYQRNLLCTQSRWQIPGHVTILYLGYSGIGDLHWSSFSSRSVNLPVDRRVQPPGLQSLLSCPLESPATPSKLSHFWKLPFSHLQNRGKNGCSFIELMEGLNNFRALNLAHDHFSTHLIFSSICWITSRSQPLFLPLRIRVANTATHSCLHKVMF